HEVAAFLKRVKARPDLVVTSPLPRASQTAEIAAEHLKVKCREDKLLAPGFGRQELERLLKKYRAESLMIVGHEPGFTQTISQLSSQLAIRCPKSRGRSAKKCSASSAAPRCKSP